MSNHVTKAVEAIYKMDNDELNQVVEAIKLKRQFLAKQAVKKFVVGDMVQFTNRSGGTINGTVRKVNRKYIIVDAHIGGTRYQVPATMLRSISEIA